MSGAAGSRPPVLVACLLGAAAAVVAVDPVAAAVAGVVPTGLFGRPFVLVAAALVGVVVLRRGVDTTEEADDDDEDWLPEQPPERAGGSDTATAGEGIDALLASLADPRDEEYPDAAGREVVRSRVRGLAVETVADAAAVDPEAVERQLGTGEWTADPRAAAFLGADRALPLRTRVADWLAGERFQRQLRAAVDELCAFAGSEPRDGAVIDGDRAGRIERVRRAELAHAAAEDAAPAIDARAVMTAHGRSVDRLDELPEPDAADDLPAPGRGAAEPAGVAADE